MTKKLSVPVLFAIVQRALACVNANDTAGAQAHLRTVPVGQRSDVLQALRGAVEDAAAKKKKAV